MKVLLSFLVLIFFFTNAQAQEIEATLGGNTSTDGFSVRNLSGTSLFRVGGDGNVVVANGDGEAFFIESEDLGGNGSNLNLNFFNKFTSYTQSFSGRISVQASGTNNEYTGGRMLFFTKANDGFNTVPVERMRINEAGNVGIGTVSPNYKLEVNSSSNNIFAASITNTSTSGHGLQVTVGSSGTEGAFDIYTNSFGNIFKVEAGGVVSGNYGTYHAPSDIRLKKEIMTIPDALTKVMELRGVNFKWKDPERGQSLQMGFIAQEVEKVVPEVVHTADDEMKTKSVEYQYLVGLLIEAVKEQQKQIEELESRINSIALKEIDSESYGYIKSNNNSFEKFYSVMR